MTITLTGNSVTLDESSGLQNTGIPTATEDNNDNDVGFNTLQSAFASRLFDAGGLALDSTFAQDNGVAKNSLITLSGGTTVTGFLDGSDNPLLAFEVGVTDPTTGVETSFTTLDGEKIYLFIDQDSGLGDMMALGVAANGDIVFAAFLDPQATSADIWMVQFEPINNPVATDHDDPVDLTGLLNVGGATALSFNFDALPSGQNLFGTVGQSSTDPAIIVIGRDIVLKADGTFANTSNTINTSQGGGPTTIGVNNQMFNPGEGAYFSYVNDPVANFLSGAPGGLTQNEADDADNIQYTGGTLDVTSAFFVVSQIQGNSLATAQVTTFLGAAETGVDFVNALGDGTSPDIIQVKVYNEAGTLIEDTGDLVNFNDPSVVVTGLGTPTVQVSGLGAGYKVEWVTDGDHNQALIEDVAGKFDIGAFGISEGVVSSVPVGDKLIFEDDGPAVDRSSEGVPTLTVDDSDFATNASASFASLFTPDFGTDGPKDTNNDGIPDTDATTYALGVSAPGADSGLVDTLTNEAVVLNVVGTDVVGTTETTGLEVFKISVDASGQVTLDQSRAVVHNDPADPDEATSPAVLSAVSLVTLTATVTDDDGDTASATADIGDAFQFKDDGPSVDRSAEAVPTLTVDDSDFGTDASASFAGLFTSAFGADGPKDSDNDDLADADAITYALDVSAPGVDSGLVDTLTNEAIVLNLVGGDVVGTTAIGGLEVFRVSVDASGQVTLDQSRAVVHDDPNDPDEAASPAVLSAASLITLAATVTDGDGDTDTATADIGDAFQFKDDGPAIDPSAEDVPTLTVDDSDLATNASLSFAGLFTAPLFGADGPKDTDNNDVADDDAVSYALAVNAPAADSGLVDTETGEAVVLNLVGSDVVGTTETTGLEVFRISVDGAGAVTLDQSRAIVHDDPNDPDEAASPAMFSAADLVTLTATVTDGDGDTDTATVDISAAFQFKDDGPAIGPIDDDLVDFVTGASASNLLLTSEGADGAAAEITAFTPSLTYSFATLLGELSADGKSVIYFQDVGGGVGTFDDGIDVKFFTLAIDDSDADAANWNYTFTVHQDAPPDSLEFNFDALPSGQNLFGTVGASSTDPAIIVIGRDIVLEADGTFDNSSDTINTSQGGGPTTIGVNNQMIDAGEGAYFSYVDDPVANFLSGAPGGLDQNEADDADNIQYTGGTVDVTSSFFVVSQIQGNDLATVDITTFDLASAETGVDFVNNLGNGTSPDIIQVKVFDENGNLIEDTSDLGNFDDPNIVVTGIGDPTVEVAGLDAGYKVEWVTDGEHNQTLVEGVAGKFDIGAFGISEPQPTPDKSVEFTVAITDFDGDSEEDTFMIGIDGDHDGSINIV